jgi:hypothetical protein
MNLSPATEVAVHRPYGSYIDSLAQELGEDLGRGLVHEPLFVQDAMEGGDFV